jgi:hypothetical protein
MQSLNGSKEMLRQWARMEHYRLHCAESRTDSAEKRAVLASIHSALERLEAESGPVECAVCASRQPARARVLMFPSRSKVAAAIPPRAA